MKLKVLIVSGIWPPDVGGPASHGPDFGRFLLSHGHDVHAVTTAGEGGAESCGFPVSAWPRGRSRFVRMAVGTGTVAAAARWPDVVYSTGLYYKSALAATVNRVPLVVKLTTDPAFERSRRLGLYSGDLASFQRPHPGKAIRYLKLVRAAMLSKAERLVIPSRYLADMAPAWGVSAGRVAVVPNPPPQVGQLPRREELRRRLGIDAATFVFVGRLVAAKQLSLAVSAFQQVAGACLIIIGDGPERNRVEESIADRGLEGRVLLKGALPRSEAIEWLRAADAALLSSAYENFPHAAVEAIAVGTPVVSTAVGGVPEIIETGVNGILVPPGDERGLAEAMSSLTKDPKLAAELQAGASASAARYDADRAYGAIERVLLAAVLRGDPGPAEVGGGTEP